MSSFSSGGPGDAIFRYHDNTGAPLGTHVPAGSGGMGAPMGIAIGPVDQQLYVADFKNAVRKYDRATGAPLGVFVATGSGGLTRAGGLTFGPDGRLYVASEMNDSVLRYDGTTGAFIDAFVPAASGSLDRPSGLTFGPDGSLFVVSFGNSRILRYDGATGAFLGTFVNTVAGGLNSGLAFGADGNLYASRQQGGVLRFNGQTGASMGFFTNGPSFARALVFGPDGDLFVGDGSTWSVHRYDGTTGAFEGEFVSPQSGGLASPGYMLFTAIPEPRLSAVIAAGALFRRRSRFRQQPPASDTWRLSSDFHRGSRCTIV